MDQYCSGDFDGVDLIMSVFLEMLEGNQMTQKLAFELLFNLSVHANLYDSKISLQHSPSPETSFFLLDLLLCFLPFVF